MYVWLGYRPRTSLSKTVSKDGGNVFAITCVKEVNFIAFIADAISTLLSCVFVTYTTASIVHARRNYKQARL